ncbi:hypothetical protein IGI04_036799 [Brassica rapa subsp. trilocularis]|uniref:F-box associated beta-propeller type 3 domain-containing protein n=1 Tax=Brassica rapa subsp. trilocularis TaxID=1813537 RepID=A0ABQ7LFJ4_BRACM|nr:hypothetical protein IGI04_036799 [Brassica rapa subsp. trilocularis]
MDVHLVMVLFGYGPIWTWCYLGSTKNTQKKISPSGHAQIHPVRPVDIPKCKYPHRHNSGCKGICKDGFMYYLATCDKKRSLMSFDLSSEEFNVTKLPEEFKT